jgi:flavin-dependent dehydrogenase
LSTNHLMGEGYWVWLIPLAGDRTSVGIVSDERLHPFNELHTFDAALAWLDRNEPQCAEVVRAHVDQRMDFRALKHFSHDAQQVYSSERWSLVGGADDDLQLLLLELTVRMVASANPRWP